jgi:hypothetical protein
MRETFKKSDLKTGMIVEMRDGSKFTVMLDTVAIDKDVLIGVENDYDWERLSNYTDDLINTNCSHGDCDIVKVYQPSHCYSFVASNKLNANYRVNDNELIWERKERTDFLDDKEAMIDFLALSKDAFLFSHYAYTEEMYDNTYALVEEKLGLR